MYYCKTTCQRNPYYCYYNGHLLRHPIVLLPLLREEANEGEGDGPLSIALRDRTIFSSHAARAEKENH